MSYPKTASRTPIYMLPGDPLRIEIYEAGLREAIQHQGVRLPPPLINYMVTRSIDFRHYHVTGVDSEPGKILIHQSCNNASYGLTSTVWLDSPASARIVEHEAWFRSLGPVWLKANKPRLVTMYDLDRIDSIINVSGLAREAGFEPRRLHRIIGSGEIQVWESYQLTAALFRLGVTITE